MQTQYDRILKYMSDGSWYKATDLVEILEVKETRTQELFI